MQLLGAALFTISFGSRCLTNFLIAGTSFFDCSPQTHQEYAAFFDSTFQFFRLRVCPKHEVNWVFLTGEVRAAGAHLAGAPYWTSPPVPAQRATSAGTGGDESPPVPAQRDDPGVSAV